MYDDFVHDCALVSFQSPCQMRRATFNEKRAVDTAYRAAVVAEEAHEKEHEMQWSNRLMSNISELQRTHFKNKHEMLKVGT